MVKQMIMLPVVLGLVPLLLGMLYTKFSGKDKDSLLLNYVSGLIIMMALLQLMAIPLIFRGSAFTLLLRGYAGVLLGLCLLSLILNVRSYGRFVKRLGQRFAEVPWQIWAAVLLVAFQTGMLTFGQHIDTDDAFYVGTAVAAVDEGSMYRVDPYNGLPYQELPARYVLSPFPIFTAVLGELTDVHASAMAHTIFPLVLIPFAYMIYGLLGWLFFGGRKESVGNFLILVCVIYIFFGYSVYTQGTFLLIRVWQGKALLAGALLPAVLYYGLRAYGKEGCRSDYGMLLMLMLACCMVSSMGIMLGAIALGLLALAGALILKKPSILPGSFLCCIPNIIYAGIYLLIK